MQIPDKIPFRKLDIVFQFILLSWVVIQFIVKNMPGHFNTSFLISPLFMLLYVCGSFLVKARYSKINAEKKRAQQYGACLFLYIALGFITYFLLEPLKLTNEIIYVLYGVFGLYLPIVFTGAAILYSAQMIREQKELEFYNLLG